MAAAISAWVAEGCNRVSGQELSGAEEKSHAAPAKAAEVEVMQPWGSFEVFELLEEQNLTKTVVNTRWVLTWKIMDGRKCVEARLVGKGYWGCDRQEGVADTSVCVGFRSSHFQVIPHVGLPQNGKFGARILRTPIRYRMASVGAFFYEPLLKLNAPDLVKRPGLLKLNTPITAGVS